jgi:hypothetical protein
MGATLRGPDNDNIGKIKDLMVSPSGEFDALIVDVGGFLGIGAKSVALAIERVDFRKDDRGNLFAHVNFTRQQLEAAPEFKKETYAADRNSVLLRTAAAAPSAASASYTLAAADATKLKTWIMDQKKTAIAAPAGFTAAVGSVLPQAITFYEIPATVGVPSATTYRYAVVGDKIVLVNPTDRKVVYVFA